VEVGEEVVEGPELLLPSHRGEGFHGISDLCRKQAASLGRGRETCPGRGAVGACRHAEEAVSPVGEGDGV
jgi:hypothetical protein